MFRNGNPERVGAQMSGLAKKLHGDFGVAAFEFAMSGAHAEEILNLASRTNGLASARCLANLPQTPMPAFRKTGSPQVEAILWRDHANPHLAARGNGTAVLSAAAGVSPGTMGSVVRSEFVLRKLEVFGFSRRIAKLEFHGLFGSEANA